MNGEEATEDGWQSKSSIEEVHRKNMLILDGEPLGSATADAP
jgi:hypothetical protein